MVNATSSKPILFDKNLLASDEYKSYIYSINFGGKKVNDLSAEGYLHAISPFVEKITPQIIEMREFEASGNRKGFHAVVSVTLDLKYMNGSNEERICVAALADGTSFEAKDPAALIRIVETRALKRAVGRALDLGKKDINQMLNAEKGEPAYEDEVGTPLEKEYAPNPLHNALAESRAKIAKVLDEKKKAAAAANPSGTSTTGDGVDW